MARRGMGALHRCLIRGSGPQHEQWSVMPGGGAVCGAGGERAAAAQPRAAGGQAQHARAGRGRGRPVGAAPHRRRRRQVPTALRCIQGVRACSKLSPSMAQRIASFQLRHILRQMSAVQQAPLRSCGVLAACSCEQYSVRCSSCRPICIGWCPRVMSQPHASRVRKAHTSLFNTN